MHNHVERRIGNTSTDVEKTKPPGKRSRCFRKHLHGRGEDCVCHVVQGRLAETPPRTWRRLAFKASAAALAGNTSTDVEKTIGIRIVRMQNEKHLHGRGEDSKIWH